MFAPKSLLLSLLFAVLLRSTSASRKQTARVPAHPTVEFFGLGGKQHQQQQHPGWVREVKAIANQQDQTTTTAATKRCTKQHIIHECVVNYSWGLVGAF